MRICALFGCSSALLFFLQFHTNWSRKGKLWISTQVFVWRHSDGYDLVIFLCGLKAHFPCLFAIGYYGPQILTKSHSRVGVCLCFHKHQQKEIFCSRCSTPASTNRWSNRRRGVRICQSTRITSPTMLCKFNFVLGYWIPVRASVRLFVRLNFGGRQQAYTGRKCMCVCVGAICDSPLCSIQFGGWRRLTIVAVIDMDTKRRGNHKLHNNGRRKHRAMLCRVTNFVFILKAVFDLWNLG